MTTGYEWVTWVFSGIGVLIVSLIINAIVKKRKTNENSTVGANSPIINGNKNKVEISNEIKRE